MLLLVALSGGGLLVLASFCQSQIMLWLGSGIGLLAAIWGASLTKRLKKEEGADESNDDIEDDSQPW